MTSGDLKSIDQRPGWLTRAGEACGSSDFVMGAAIGAGMIARAAENGGADFLLALSAGRIRVMGAASIACHLAIHDANRFVMAFAHAEILRQVDLPVIFGASAFDPRLDLGRLFDRLEDAGFAGIANFPTAIHLDARLLAALAEHGLGYQREVEMIARARERGLGTVAYARDDEQAAAMAEAGADVICLNFGWNAGGSANLPSVISLGEAAETARRLFSRLRRAWPEILCVVEGGPIETAEDAAQVCRLSRADGYIGGSTIDRLPLENAVAGATASYKSIADLSQRLETLQNEMMGQGRRYGLIGRSPALAEVVRLIERIADTEFAVLVLGANGTGKEIVARALHRASRRASGRFVAVDCALPRDMVDGELFGWEAGDGGSRPGRIEDADGGTLFLDEIGDLDLQLQAKLLRFLDTGAVQRAGGGGPARRSSVRIVAASSRDIRAAVGEGRFRDDLFYRLNRIEMALPPLSERMEDLPLLVQHFLQTTIRRMKPQVRSIDGDALRVLMSHDWPGNVRELGNVLERAAILSEGERIERGALPRLGAGAEPAGPGARAPFAGRPEGGVENERDWILDGLRRNRFRRGETARWLGLSRKTLYNKMRLYGLE